MPPQPVHGEEAAAEGLFASLATKPREKMVSFTMRIPVSMDDKLDAICGPRGLDKAALVRDFIEHGLRTIEARGLPPQ